MFLFYFNIEKSKAWLILEIFTKMTLLCDMQCYYLTKDLDFLSAIGNLENLIVFNKSKVLADGNQFRTTVLRLRPLL